MSTRDLDTLAEQLDVEPDRLLRWIGQSEAVYTAAQDQLVDVADWDNPDEPAFTDQLG